MFSNKGSFEKTDGDTVMPAASSEKIVVAIFEVSPSDDETGFI